jgi:hypothetical protein
MQQIEELERNPPAFQFTLQEVTDGNELELLGHTLEKITPKNISFTVVKVGIFV